MWRIYWGHILRMITTDYMALAGDGFFWGVGGGWGGGSYSLSVHGDLLATFCCWPL